jgi:hypothetical protein
MSMAKTLYRRLPYFIRSRLSRNQSFCLVITIAAAVFVFIFFEAIFIGVRPEEKYPERDVFDALVIPATLFIENVYLKWLK